MTKSEETPTPMNPITDKLLRAKSDGKPFSKVRAARAILAERAEELVEAYIALSAEARAAGDREVAADILWKLIDHIPKDDLVGIIDSASSKPKEVSSGPTGPTIQIGIALGGVGTPKALAPTNVIDVTPDE